MIDRALTIKQPYAHAIARGWKPVENRSRPLAYTGLIAIHASTSKTDLTDDVREFFIHQSSIILDAFDDPRIDRDNPLFHFGAIIGVARIVGCVPITSPLSLARSCRDAGHSAWLQSAAQVTNPFPWASGPYCYLLQDAVQFARPIPCKGSLSLWRLPADVGAAVNHAYQHGPHGEPVEFAEGQGVA